MSVHKHTGRAGFLLYNHKGAEGRVFFQRACNSWNVLSTYLNVLAASFVRLKIGFIQLLVWLLKFIAVGKVVCAGEVCSSLPLDYISLQYLLSF